MDIFIFETQHLNQTTVKSHRLWNTGLSWMDAWLNPLIPCWSTSTQHWASKRLYKYILKWEHHLPSDISHSWLHEKRMHSLWIQIVHLPEGHCNAASHSHVSCHTVSQRTFLRSCKEVTIHFLHNFELCTLVLLVTSASTWKTISSAYSSTSHPHIHPSPCMQCLVSLTSEDIACHALEMNTQYYSITVKAMTAPLAYQLYRSRAIAQAVSCWLPTAAARVQSRVWSSGMCGGQSGAGAGFLLLLRFPLPIFIPPIAPQSPSPIIWSWCNRPEVAAVQGT
jgi:hypothetical protein